MTALVWDKSGEKVYQTGVDRGVLYLQDGTAVVWNGLTSIEETGNDTLTSYYLDGVKYLDTLTPGDFTGKLKAFTYPVEFDQVQGVITPTPGLNYYDQPSKSFNLSYRTKIGNDIDGIEHSYKIHLLYNLVANPDTFGFDSLKGQQVQPIEFAWTIVGTPPKVGSLRPTVHISIDAEDTPPGVLSALEDILYGTDITSPSLPSMTEIAQLFGYLGALIIVDHGDGTWSAIDEADDYITMVNPTTFQIDGADATYLDATTYKISTTTAHLGGEE
jgi:hypothetical protein